MSFYDRYVLPPLLRTACSARPIMRQRKKIVPLAEGRVLEIGAGGGLNFSFYDQGRVSEVIGLDISEPLLRHATSCAHEHGLPFQPLLMDAANIPLDTGEVDCVVMTYTLCSIDAMLPALAEMRRVLKPGGRMMFCEHGAAPDEKVRRFQTRLNPLWKRLAGGCNLDRDIPAAITEGGLAIEVLEKMYLPSTPRFGGYNYWGWAVGR